jgi:ABC-2 type transport system ATP-binding protein
VVVDGLDLVIPPGVTGLIGPNGAGKTTLMRALATVVPPDGGRLAVLGEDVTDAASRPSVRRRLAYLPQEIAPVQGFDVDAFVRYIALLKDVPRRDLAQCVAEALELVGLADQAGTAMRALSGGQRRRAGIAQALVNRPDLLLLDEPTAGLDPAQRLRFRDLVTSTAGRGASVVVSTHLIEDVASVCAHVVVLDDGAVVFQGTPAELAAGVPGDGATALAEAYAHLVGGRW